MSFAAKLDLELVTKTLIIFGQRIGPDDAINLLPRFDTSGPCLDGNVFTRTTKLIPKDTARQAWVSGIRWHLHPNADGTWSIPNQNQPDFCLAGVKEKPTLLAQGANMQDDPTKWLIYYNARLKAFALRPLKNAWLAVGQDGPGLAPLNSSGDPAAMWVFAPHGLEI